MSLVRHDELFRREAIDFQRRRLSGNVVLHPDPPSVTACVLYGLIVCGLAVAFALVRFSLTARSHVRCVQPGTRFLEVVRPRFPAGAALRRAEIDAPDGSRLALWDAGRYAAAPSLPHGRPQPSERCEAVYDLVSSPAAAVLHRLLQGS